MSLEGELDQFHGTTKYYRHFTGLFFADGVKHPADRADCYWSIDMVSSYQPELANAPFQL